MPMFNNQIERLRPHQIKEAREKADIAFLPLGTLEWHGVHNPIGVDMIKAHHICCVAAEKLGGGVVFPPVIWGVPRESFDVGTSAGIEKNVAEILGTEEEVVKGSVSHGGMDMQEQWMFYQRLIRMSLEQIAGFGFKSIYIVTGHQPLVHFVKSVSVAFCRQMKMLGRAVTIDYGGEFEAAELSGDHGGRWETSIMMGVDPDMVDLSEIEKKKEYLGLGAGANAVGSSEKQGKEWIDTCALKIAEEAKWLVDAYPELPKRHRHMR